MCGATSVLLLLAIILFGLMVFFHFKYYDPKNGSDIWNDLIMKILVFFMAGTFLFVALTMDEEERRFLWEKSIYNKTKIEVEDRRIEEAMRGFREMTRLGFAPNGIVLLEQRLREMTRQVLEPDEWDLQERRFKERERRLEERERKLEERERKCEDAELPVRRRS